MVSHTHKIEKSLICLAAILAPFCLFSNTYAENVDFNVNVNEVLTVSLTTPDTWASGDVSPTTGSGLLRNKVVLNVTSNNPNGYTATMFSKTTTNLTNTVKSTSTIPTLASATTASAFPANYWGYSVDDTDAGTTTANYAAMQTNAITLATVSTPSALNKSVYFGAKADFSKDSGTYANTVVFNVVSEVDPSDVDPEDPTPAPTPTPTPIPDNPNTPTYDSGTDTTAYKTITTGTQTAPVDTTTTTTTTQISKGNTTTSYQSPHGVTSTTGGSNGALAAGLAIASATAAASGTFFFILAKRKKDDDEEEEEEGQQ